MLPGAQLPRPIMLCSCSKIDVTCIRAVLQCKFFPPVTRKKIEVSLIMVVDLNYTLHFVVLWNWKCASDSEHLYHFCCALSSCTHACLFPLFLHHVGCEPLLDVNWSVCNPHYRIRLQLYVAPFAKPQRSLFQRPYGKNHSCTQSMMVNLQSNHTADHTAIWSVCS